MMKKHSFILLILAVLLALIAVGCKNSGDDVLTQVYIPSLVKSNSSARSMSVFPQECIFGNPSVFSVSDIDGMNLWMAANAMSTLPLFPGLEKVSDTTGNLKKLKNTEYVTYGFPLRISDIGVSDSGLYIRYDILEVDNHGNESIIGVADYFYSNGSTPKFSYRQFVTPFLEEKNDGMGNNLLYFEMTNVPINSDGSFSAGIKNGKFDNGSCLIFDKIRVNNGVKMNLFLTRNSMLYVSNATTLEGAAASEVVSTAFHTANTVELTSNTDSQLFNNLFKLGTEGDLNCNCYFKDSTQSYALVNSKWKLNDCMKIMEVYYTKESLNNWFNVSNSNKITTIEEFNSYNLKLNPSVSFHDANDMGYCTRYVLDKAQTEGYGATVGPYIEFLGDIFMDDSNINNLNCEANRMPDGKLLTLLSYEKFNEYDNCLATRSDFAEAHLKVCGITDTDNYIENYIDSCQTRNLRTVNNINESDWAHYPKEVTSN